MSNLSKFNYNGTEITFSKGDNVMINATEMAKPFGKQPSDWMRLSSSKAFADELARVRGIPRTDFVKISQGGSNQGTWLHEDVAIEFARWLNPAFAIWCNDRIKELMRYGMTATPAKIEEMLANPENWIKTLQTLQKERDARERAERTIEEQAPAVEYHNKVLQSESDYNSTTIAKELGMSAIEFHQRLKQLGIMFKTDGHWVLYAKYQNKGYTRTRTATFKDSIGYERTNITTVWTEKGREFIHKILNPELKKQYEL